ncbi:putative DnaJ domain, Chaperone J-domain superfamily [Dioscorea sansibarensis]
MQAFGWRRGILSRNSTPIQCTLAAFHSTPLSLSKWKTKWKNQDEAGSQKPCKTYARYAVRLKRADTKKALKDFLLYGKPSNLIQDGDLTRSTRSKAESRFHDFDTCPRSKSSGRSKPPSNSSEYGKGKRHKGKRWNDKWRYGYNDDDFGHHEVNFQASFGGHRTFNWSFPSWENYRFENSTSGFEWRDEAKWEKIKKKFLNESDIEEEEPSDLGRHTDRVALGLPATGSLKLDDVKTAFRTSALKWHPDKHQGPSQAVAAEKFKRCVDAYKSLCNALKNN